MLISSISNTYWCHGVGEPCKIMDSLCFYFGLADVVASDFRQLGVIGRHYCHVAFRFATYVLCFGWCYSHVALLLFMADGDVVVIWLMFVLTDVIAICFCGCWYCHFWSSVVPKGVPLLLLLFSYGRHYCQDG